MVNQSVSAEKKENLKKISLTSQPPKRRGRPRLPAVSEEIIEDEALPSETESAATNRGENKKSVNYEDFDEEIDPESDWKDPEETAVENILDFLDGLDSESCEEAITVHVYRFPPGKPETLLGRADRIKVGTLPFNRVTWEDDVHTSLPKGGFCYIEFRWNRDIWIGDVRVRRVGTVAKGITRRFDPLPSNGAPSEAQHERVGLAPATPTRDYFELQREALFESQKQMMGMFTFFSEMMKSANGGSNAPPPAPVSNPRIEALEGRLFDIAFEALKPGESETPAPAASSRPAGLFDVLSNGLVALINRTPPEAISQVMIAMAGNVAANGMAQAPTQQPIESPAIEPGAKEAEIVENEKPIRYPLAKDADFKTKYQRVLTILYEDWMRNLPVTESAEAIRELFAQHPEHSGVFQMLKGWDVPALKENLLKSYAGEAEQAAIKNCAHADGWLGELKKSLQ